MGAIPSLILRHNLYGVDIDLRAVQLAGLSLFIKAQLALRALREVEGAAGGEGRITHLNLVVADAVLPADGARHAFLEQYRDNKVVQDAVRQVLDEMENVAQVGSLLRVETRLRDILGQAGHRAVQGLEGRRQRGLPGFEPEVRQLSLAEISGAAPEQWGAHYTVQRLLDDLRAFAAQALQTHDLNAQLFAEEAEKSVHLLDVFLNDYDVVVMNPPYGGTTSQGNLYLKVAYPDTGNDLYAAFVERATELLGASGYAGALTSRTFLHLRTFSGLRQRLLGEYGGLVTLAEFGIGVLDDATVRPTAYVVRSPKEQSSNRIIFFGLRSADDRNREFIEALAEASVGHDASNVFFVGRETLDSLPGRVISYWVTDSLGALFDDLLPLDRDIAYQAQDKVKIADVKAGLCTGQDAMFVRNWWELEPERCEGWYPFNKGGSFGRYYSDIEWVVDWRNDGNVIRNLKELHGLTGARVQNEQFYFLEGLSYPYISDKGLSVRHHPPGRIFSHGARGIFPHEDVNPWILMGILNSKLLEALLQTLTVDRKHETGIVASLPIAIGIGKTEDKVSRLSKSAHDIKATWDTGNELCTRFDAPWLLQAHRGTLLAGASEDLDLPQPPGEADLPALLDHVRAVEAAADARLQALQAQIDEAVYNLYAIAPQDRALIERELGDRPPELVWPQMEGKKDREKRREHVRRLLSYCLLGALREKPDGILPLCPGTGHPTALEAVRRRLEALLGEAAAFKIESAARRVLGRDVGDWLDGPFIQWHTRLYKRRPVIWQLASDDYHHTFSCFVHVHKLDGDTLRKVQTQYLWPQRRTFETALGSARATGDGARQEEAELALETLAQFEERLLSVIQAQVACALPDWAEGPYRGGVYDPVLDDGVKVNLTPLQEAGVLRYRKVV